MIGFRGAARYLSPDFTDCFARECDALRYVRDTMGLTNVKIMIPFVRTLTEAEGVVRLLAEYGLSRGVNSLEVIMMCELPSDAVVADAFLDHFDGFSIGSNDLTQLTLGLDRDSGLVAATFDERDPVVKFLISSAIKACKARGKYVGICGQGPSDHPDLPSGCSSKESTAFRSIPTRSSTPGSDSAVARGRSIPDPGLLHRAPALQSRRHRSALRSAGG